MSKAKKVLVEGFEFMVHDAVLRSDPHSYTTIYGEQFLAGNMTIEINMVANSGSFSKKDWGELMGKIGAGKVMVVVTE